MAPNPNPDTHANAVAVAFPLAHRNTGAKPHTVAHSDGIAIAVAGGDTKPVANGDAKPGTGRDSDANSDSDGDFYPGEEDRTPSAQGQRRANTGGRINSGDSPGCGGGRIEGIFYE